MNKIGGHLVSNKNINQPVCTAALSPGYLLIELNLVVFRKIIDNAAHTRLVVHVVDKLLLNGHHHLTCGLKETIAARVKYSYNDAYR